MRILFLAAAFALSACATRGPTPVASDWRAVASSDDRERLREWRGGFVRALAKARAAGHGAAIDAEGRLLAPDAALGGPLPNGDYRCRIIKVGARGPGLLDYIAYPGFACRVTQEGALQYFAKLTRVAAPDGPHLPRRRDARRVPRRAHARRRDPPDALRQRSRSHGRGLGRADRAAPLAHHPARAALRIADRRGRADPGQ